ncbi:MAG: alpha/beta hydrolase [Bacteroidales bacterium]
MAELFANQKDSNTNKSHFDFNDLDTSLIEFIPAETKPSKAITVVVHGLNNKPSIMKSICKMLSEHGSDVILIKLTGHRNDPQNLANITRQIWLTDLLESHNYAKSLIESSEKKPLYFIGYSIGALINLDLISSNPKLVHYDKMILFAPANATKWSTNLLKLSFSLGNEQKIPSFSPKDYRANDGIPIKVYILIEKYTTFSLKSIPLIKSNPLLWQGPSNTKQDDKYGYETRDYEALFTRGRQRAKNCA